VVLVLFTDISVSVSCTDVVASVHPDISVTTPVDGLQQLENGVNFSGSDSSYLKHILNRKIERCYKSSQQSAMPMLLGKKSLQRYYTFSTCPLSHFILFIFIFHVSKINTVRHNNELIYITDTQTSSVTGRHPADQLVVLPCPAGQFCHAFGYTMQKYKFSTKSVNGLFVPHTGSP